MIPIIAYATDLLTPRRSDNELNKQHGYAHSHRAGRIASPLSGTILDTWKRWF
jgi:hypothetical protein